MKKTVHRAPTQEEINSYRMQVTTDENYTHYRINLATTSEDQKRRLSERYGISLKVLEDDTLLILSVIRDY
jgi:hypothetical protein